MEAVLSHTFGGLRRIIGGTFRNCACAHMRVAEFSSKYSQSPMMSPTTLPFHRPLPSRSYHIYSMKRNPTNLVRPLFTGAPKKPDTAAKPFEEKEYNEIADETLDSLTAFFDDLNDTLQKDSDFDVTFSSGVLTVKIPPSSTFVINKQTPNRQIWLSSPLTGPKRFDFVDGAWIYLHDGTCLHNLLSTEISELLKEPISFAECAYA